MAAGAHTGALETRPLAVDRLTVVVARSHPLARAEEIGFAELLDQPFVGLSAGALHDHLAQQAARLGRRIGYRVRLRSFDAVARLLEAGIGVGVLPLAAVERHRTPALRAIRLADDWANRPLLHLRQGLQGSQPARAPAGGGTRTPVGDRPLREARPRQMEAALPDACSEQSGRNAIRHRETQARRSVHLPGGRIRTRWATSFAGSWVS